MQGVLSFVRTRVAPDSACLVIRDQIEASAAVDTLSMDRILVVYRDALQGGVRLAGDGICFHPAHLTSVAEAHGEILDCFVSHRTAKN